MSVPGRRISAPCYSDSCSGRRGKDSAEREKNVEGEEKEVDFVVKYTSHLIQEGLLYHAI